MNRKEFQKDDFEKIQVKGKEYGVYFKKTSLPKLFSKWSAWYKEEEMFSKRWKEQITRKRLIEKQIRHFTHYLVGDEKEYIPFNSNRI